VQLRSKIDSAILADAILLVMQILLLTNGCLRYSLEVISEYYQFFKGNT
jgi:hypothetical protein